MSARRQAEATRAGRLEEIRSLARFHRDRYDLYRARAYGPRPTRPDRLRELERACEAAEERLRHAEATAGSA